MDIQRLEERLQKEREERGRLELELEKLQRERAILEEQTEQRGRRFTADGRCDCGDCSVAEYNIIYIYNPIYELVELPCGLM